jgi:hypothetical protein
VAEAGAFSQSCGSDGSIGDVFDAQPNQDEQDADQYRHPGHAKGDYRGEQRSLEKSRALGHSPQRIVTA